MNAHAFIQAVQDADLVGRTGRVRRIFPTYVEADGPAVSPGALCTIETRSEPVLAEVASVTGDGVVLVPFESRAPTFSGAAVVACPEADTAPMGDEFLGRAVDALARPIDGKGPIHPETRRTLYAAPVNPLERVTPNRPLQTGLRAIDGLLTLGHGQRVGLFAASGVGKTSLMAQLARQVDADRCVVCLVGERGREVEALWSDGLPDQIKARTTLVAATSDETAAMRVRACDYALALADHWRSAGHQVLLLLDSVTRLAMAMREIGLAAGEPPTVRAYTPSVFAAVPKLVERCGALKSGGSITAIMTVLSETDDVDDPISEMMKSLLDGHIILSRSLAEQGHFPAIDAPRSVSRLAPSLMSEAHRAAAERAGQLLSLYESSRNLIEAGIYAKGANPDIDQALDKRPALLRFLKQREAEFSSYEASTAALAAAVLGKA